MKCSGCEVNAAEFEIWNGSERNYFCSACAKDTFLELIENNDSIFFRSFDTNLDGMNLRVVHLN